jgi:hypothetical protein
VRPFGKFFLATRQGIFLAQAVQEGLSLLSNRLEIGDDRVWCEVARGSIEDDRIENRGIM